MPTVPAFLPLGVLRPLGGASASMGAARWTEGCSESGKGPSASVERILPVFPGALSVDSSGEVTRLLESARNGDSDALARVVPLLYEELRRLASANLRRHATPATLQTTALVHEAYLRLVDREAPWVSRAHFFHVAASAMRSILIDHARGRKAQKRGGRRLREPFDEALSWFEERSIDLIALGEALDALEREDPRRRRLVELRFFAGLSTEDAAEVLGVSRATAARDWVVARTWLFRRLGGSPRA